MVHVHTAIRRVFRVDLALSLSILVLLSFVTLTRPAHAMEIKVIKSPGGIEAWLVEAHNNPLLAIKFAFEGGNSQDPVGKDGLANFLSAMLDEGAGDMTSAEFQERVETIAMRMSYDDSRDAFYGNFETLTEHRDEAVGLLRLALSKPRFDQDAVDRIRSQLLANLAYADKDPDKVASREWFATAFAGHAYGRPAQGTEATVNAITRDDLEAYRKRVFAKDRLKIVAVGDITEAELGKLLDTAFGDLPKTGDLLPVAQTKPAPRTERWIEMDVPQSVAVFGLPSMPRRDPDFLTAFVVNQIVGGGGFSSRLMEEVREKRGLAYSVYSYLQPFKHASILSGGVATKSDAIRQSLDVIQTELQKLADEGPGKQELEDTKSYLIGSYALRFDTNSKIASQLLGLYEDDFGPDYIQKRNDLVAAITVEDAKRVAKRLLDTQGLIVTIVGKSATKAADTKG